jgi:hypothetical protein
MRWITCSFPGRQPQSPNICQSRLTRSAAKWRSRSSQTNGLTGQRLADRTIRQSTRSQLGEGSAGPLPRQTNRQTPSPPPVHPLPRRISFGCRISPPSPQIFKRSILPSCPNKQNNEIDRSTGGGCEREGVIAPRGARGNKKRKRGKGKASPVEQAEPSTIR